MHNYEDNYDFIQIDEYPYGGIYQSSEGLDPSLQNRLIRSVEIACLIPHYYTVQSDLSPDLGESMKNGDQTTDDAKLSRLIGLIENEIGHVEAVKLILRRASPEDRALIASMAAAVECCSRTTLRSEIVNQDDLKAYNRAAKARSRAKLANDPAYKEKQKEASRIRSRSRRSTQEGAKAACEAVKRSQQRKKAKEYIFHSVMNLTFD